MPSRKRPAASRRPRRSPRPRSFLWAILRRACTYCRTQRARTWNWRYTRTSIKGDREKNPLRRSVPSCKSIREARTRTSLRCKIIATLKHVVDVYYAPPARNYYSLLSYYATFLLADINSRWAPEACINSCYLKFVSREILRSAFRLRPVLINVTRNSRLKWDRSEFVWSWCVVCSEITIANLMSEPVLN